MAKYTVRKGDNPLKLATQFGISPQKLLQTNGIQSLTAGQTIKIPSNIGGGLTPYNPVSAAQNQTVPSYVAPIPTTYRPPNALQYTNGLPPPVASTPPFMTQAMLPNTNSATSAMALGQNTVIPPNIGIPQNTTTNQGVVTTPTTPVIPAGYVYGSNATLDAEQRRIWNIQAGGTGNEQVKPLSREDVWNRKAAQRRKQMAKEDNSPSPAPVSPITGNASNTALSWRVG